MLIPSRRSRPIALALAALALAATTACDIVTADLKSQATADWRKTFTLEPGGRLEIENVNGRIHVTPSDGQPGRNRGAEEGARRCRTTRRRTALGSDRDHRQRLRRRRFTSRPRSRAASGMLGGSTEVSLHRYASRPAPTSSSSPSTAASRSRGLTGKIDAETTNGGIVAREVGGPIEATTTNGGVEVELTAVAKGGVKLGCTNGGIKLRLPRRCRRDTSRPASPTAASTPTACNSRTTESIAPQPRGRMNGGGPPIRDRGHERRDQDQRPLSRVPRQLARCAALARQPALQQPEHRRFAGRERVRGLRDAASALGDGRQHRAIHVGVENRRMDVALPAHRLGVAQPLGDRFDGAGRCCVLACASESNASKSRSSCAASTVPAQVRKSLDVKSSPVISRRYAFTSAESIVCRLPSSSTILEQLLPRQIAARLDDAGEPAIVEVDLVLDAALAAERERHLAAAHLDVAVPQRRQAERTILAGVLVVADADQRLLEQLHDRREHFLLRQARLAAGPRRCGAAPLAAPARSRSGGSTWSRRALRASAGDSDTACGRARRGPSPADGRAGRG